MVWLEKQVKKQQKLVVIFHIIYTSYEVSKAPTAWQAQVSKYMNDIKIPEVCLLALLHQTNWIYKWLFVHSVDIKRLLFIHVA